MSENKNKFCIYCGTPLEEGWLFCKQCGEKVTSTEETPVEIETKEEEILVFDTEIVLLEGVDDETVEIEDAEELKVEETEEIIYNINRDDLVDLYNGLARKNSLTIFSIFLIAFLIIIATFFMKLWVITGIVTTCCGFIALAIVTTNKSYKKLIDILSPGVTKLKIEEESFIIEKTLEDSYQCATIKYEDVVNIEENANIMILTTKNNVIHVIDKKALGDKYLLFRNKFLKYLKICNGQAIKKEQIALGRYDYCEETADTISVTDAKTKAMRTSFYTFFIAIMLFIVSIYFNKLFLMLIFVPIGIIEIIYIKKLNKKIQNDMKIVGELILTILFTSMLGFFGLLSLLGNILSVL